jgi:hypothetical protein
MSKLKGKKPVATEKRLKALFYGLAGAGKTTAAISFPRVYLIDTEKGATNDQYVKIINDNGGVVFQTTSFEELLEEVTALLCEKHEYKTLVIDPLTILYNDLLDKAERAVGSEFGRHYGVANKEMKKLLNLLIRLDMNVILTCHAKNEYGDNLKVIGTTFDGYKKLDYLFDLVFEIQKRGKNRVALVKKSRIEAFEDAEVFPFSYEEVAKRYGKEILERDSKPQELASADQLIEYHRLIELFHVEPAIREKWLERCHASTPQELSKDAIEKIINHLQSQATKGDK